MRSKTTVLLLILGGMTVLFAIGLVWRVVRPSPVERAIRELPTYPGARDTEAAEGAARLTPYAENPAGEVRFVAYALPTGASSEQVVRWYRTHKPRDWRRVGRACYARGDVRVILLPQTARLLYVLVADNVRCP